MADLLTPTELADAFYRVFEDGDTSHLEDILASGWVNHPADEGHTPDVDGFAGGVEDLRKALQNLHIERRETVTDGDVIVCRIRVSGVFVAPFAGIEPTGADAGFDAMDMHYTDHGKITQSWHFEHPEQLAARE